MSKIRTREVESDKGREPKGAEDERGGRSEDVRSRVVIARVGSGGSRGGLRGSRARRSG